MKILSIDQATRSGFYFVDTKTNETNLFHFSLSNRNKNIKFYYFRKKLEEVKLRFNPDVVLFELTNFNIKHKNFNYNHVILSSGLIASIKEVFYDKKIIGYNNMTVWATIPKHLYKERHNYYVTKKDKKRVTLNYIQNNKGINCFDKDDLADAVLIFLTGKRFNFKEAPKKDKKAIKTTKSNFFDDLL